MTSVSNMNRVRRASSDRLNRKIDQLTDANIARYSKMSPEVIQRRIEALDREWDVERVLEANASTLALTGLALGLTRSAKWFILPGVVLPFLLQHAIQGWCPPLPILRQLGIRTRGEIDREKYALLEAMKTSSH